MQLYGNFGCDLGYKKLQKCNNFKVHTLLQLQPFIDRANSGQLTTYSECTFCKLWQKLQIYFEHIQIPYYIGFLTTQFRYFKTLKSYRFFDLRFLIFFVQNGFDLLWVTNCSSKREKLLKFEAEGQEFVKITTTIYSNSERSVQFLVTECLSWRFLISDNWEQ